MSTEVLKYVAINTGFSCRKGYEQGNQLIRIGKRNLASFEESELIDN